MPLIYFVDLDNFIQQDKDDKIYEIMPMQRPKSITFTEAPINVSNTGFANVDVNALINMSVLINGDKENIQVKSLENSWTPLC